MGKQLSQWLDEFVAKGADARNVVDWPEDPGSGGRDVEYHDTQYYYEHRTTAFPQGVILVYSDYKLDEESGTYIPGVKIADGVTQVQYLPFINQDTEEEVQEISEEMEAVTQQVETVTQQVGEVTQQVETVTTSVETLSETIEEKSVVWDNKLNYEDDIVDETLVFNRN